ncbi:MAG: hypothetical protein GWP14_02675 [Actinobacteria bacterium]|nr:hypothetical protein [Actinomycetota bacterium]
MLIALLLRLAGVAYVDFRTDAPRNLFHWTGSAGEYPEVAQQIVSGNGFCFRVFDGQPIPSAYLPPGYAYLLAGFFWLLGDGLTCFLSLQILHVILGTLICWLVFRLGELVFTRPVGLLAGYICAFYPTSVFMSTQIHPAPIYIFLNLLIVLIILTISKEHWSGSVLFAGLLQGILILFRPQALVYTPLLALWLGGRLRARVLLGPIVFIALAAAVVVPWTVRNYMVFNRFIPVTDSFGFNLWRGQNDLPRPGESNDLVSRGIHPNLASIPRDKNYELARDDIYKQAAFDYIKADPARALLNAARKMAMFWTYNPYHKRGRSPLVWAPWLILSPFFVIGLIHSLAKRRAPWMFYAYLIVHTLLCGVFLCLPRYRMFIEPIVFIFAAVGLLLLYQRLTLRGARCE